MVRTSANVNDVFWQAKGRGDKSTIRDANIDATAQLALLTKSPDKNGTLLVEGQRMITPSCNFRDLLEAVNENGSVLDCDICTKMQSAIACLKRLFSQLFSKQGYEGLYLERAPAVDQTLLGKSKGRVVTGSNLRENCARREA